MPAAVVDYMQETHLDAVRRDAAYDEWRRWSHRNDYWYGDARYGWPRDRVYIIREHPEHKRSEPNLRER